MMVHSTRLEVEKARRWNKGRSSLVLDLWYWGNLGDIGLEVYPVWLTVWACSQEREAGLECSCTEILVCRCYSEWRVQMRFPRKIIAMGRVRCQEWNPE